MDHAACTSARWPASTVRLLPCLLAVLPSVATAFPYAAGSCKPGTEALLQTALPEPQSHYAKSQFGTTRIEDYNLTLSIDNETVSADRPFDFSVRQNHIITLGSTNDDNLFRGFLIRLESPTGKRTFTSLRPVNEQDFTQQDIAVHLPAIVSPSDTVMPESVTNVQESTQCTDVARVGGICHNNPTPKSQVHGILFMLQEDKGMPMDVTVVIRNSNVTDVSHWYHTQYILNAVAPSTDTLPPTNRPPDSPIPTTSPPTQSQPEPTPVPTQVQSDRDRSAAHTAPFALTKVRAGLLATASFAWLITA